MQDSYELHIVFLGCLWSCGQDRNKFSKLCDSLRIDQPEWSQFATLEEARRFCKTAGVAGVGRGKSGRSRGSRSSSLLRAPNVGRNSQPPQIVLLGGMCVYIYIYLYLYIYILYCIM